MNISIFTPYLTTVTLATSKNGAPSAYIPSNSALKNKSTLSQHGTQRTSSTTSDASLVERFHLHTSTPNDFSWLKESFTPIVLVHATELPEVTSMAAMVLTWVTMDHSVWMGHWPHANPDHWPWFVWSLSHQLEFLPVVLYKSEVPKPWEYSSVWPSKSLQSKVQGAFQLSSTLNKWFGTNPLFS